jgi:hypothetical protein
MAEAVSLPPVFDSNKEADKFLAGIKKRASTKFSWKKQASLESAMRLAYWLFVFGKEGEALEVCRFMGTYEFSGNFNLWSWVEFTLALQSRIVRQRGQDDESAQCLRRIRSAGFVEARLAGSLLDDRFVQIDKAVVAKDKTGEREWSLTALLELCVLTELGGSDTRPAAALEQDFQRIAARLRAILNLG